MKSNRLIGVVNCNAMFLTCRVVNEKGIEALCF